VNTSFYRLSAKNLQGREITMGEYEGKVVLVVNTASKCGFTPQYEGLEQLYGRYRERGFVILGFPCNQFGNQEPGDARSIAEGCLLNYGVSFPMFEKIDVNGRNTHPIFTFLKQTLPGIGGGRIKWNFTKFLLDAEGRPVRRFAPFTEPGRLEPHIRALMGLKKAAK
jgi:glutathione peroxidase